VIWTLLGLIDGKVLLVATIIGTLAGGVTLFKGQCEDKRYEEEEE
jgi:hypothetical protein